MSIPCPRCGSPNPDEANFCLNCGAPLHGGPMADQTSVLVPVEVVEEDETAAEEQALAAALLPGSALLVVRHGPSAGSRFLLDADRVRAGRSPDSEVFLDDVTVSRKHAEFRRGPAGYTVRDLGSLNGTYVNRHLVDERALADGDEVQVGKYRLVYLAPRPAEAP